MEVDTLQRALGNAVNQFGRHPDGVLISSFSIHPPNLQRILRNLPIQPGMPEAKGADIRQVYPHVFCFFQRYSFRSAAELGYPEQIRGKARRLRIEQFNRVRTFTSFRIRTRQPVRKQLHLKVAILRFGNRLHFIQFARNIDATGGAFEQVLYRGLPQNLDRLLGLFKEILNYDDNRPPDPNGNNDRDKYVDDMDNRKPEAITEIDAMLRSYGDNGNQQFIDANAHLVVQGFDTSIGEGFNVVLRGVMGSPVDTLYKQWARRDKESVLLMHFPYVNNGLETNLCSVVVNPLSLDVPERMRTSVELTYSSTPHLRHFQHESWLCRLDGRRATDRVLWFFLLTSNLTLPSWIPERIHVGAANEPHPRYNLECGVVVFESAAPNPSLFPQPLRDRIATLLRPSDFTNLTTVKCNVNRETLPPPAAPLDVPQDGADCVPSNGTLLGKVLRLDDNGRSTWDWFQDAKKCLLERVLPGMVGLSRIRRAMKYSYYMRWAVYDYIFNDLARKHPVARVTAYDELVTKRYFVEEIARDRDAHPWSKCKTARATLDALVDIFVRWSNAFDLYDVRINATRPVVTADTLITLHDARHGEQVVEDAHQKHRAPPLAPGAQPPPPQPPRLGRVDCTPYDTLTFLVQSMNASSYVWWKCAKGHEFYWTPQNMMLGINACPVCAKYHDIRMLYELLKQNPEVRLLTTEFPLMRKAVLEDRKQVDVDREDVGREMDSARNRALMKYDIFFIYRDLYVCGIEFDDASHNDKALNLEPIAINRPSADGAKNVISSAMGIHLMRVWAAKPLQRPNAKSRLKLLVDTFLAAVASNGLQLAGTGAAFLARMAFFQNLPFNKPLRARDLVTLLDRGPENRTQFRWEKPGVVEPNRTYLRNLVSHNNIRREFPVSLIFSTDVPDQELGNERALVDAMIEKGYSHPCMPYTVRVGRQTDNLSNRTYHDLLQEYKRSESNDAFVVRDVSYVGRLMDQISEGHNGLVLVSNIERHVEGEGQEHPSVTLSGYLLEPRNIGPWAMLARTMPVGMLERRKTKMTSIAKHYVRIKDPRDRDGFGNAPRAQDPDDFPPPENQKRWPTERIVGEISGNQAGDDDSDDEEEKEDDEELEDDVEEELNEDDIRRGWPDAARWALRGNQITYMNPQNPVQKETRARYWSANFQRALVIEVGKYERRDQRGEVIVPIVKDWWIGVKQNHGAWLKWIRQTDFDYVTRYNDPDQTPLSAHIPTQAQPEQMGRTQRDRQAPEYLEDYDTGGRGSGRGAAAGGGRGSGGGRGAAGGGGRGSGGGRGAAGGGRGSGGGRGAAGGGGRGAAGGGRGGGGGRGSGQES